MEQMWGLFEDNLGFQEKKSTRFCKSLSIPAHNISLCGSVALSIGPVEVPIG